MTDPNDVYDFGINPTPDKFGMGQKIMWKLDNEGLSRHGMTLGWAGPSTILIVDAPDYNFEEPGSYEAYRVFISHVADSSLTDYTDIREINYDRSKPKKQLVNIKDFPVGTEMMITLEASRSDAGPVKVRVDKWDTSVKNPTNVYLTSIDGSDGPSKWVDVATILEATPVPSNKLNPTDHPVGSVLSVITKEMGVTVVVLDWDVKNTPSDTVRLHWFGVGLSGEWFEASDFEVLSKEEITFINAQTHPVGTSVTIDGVFDTTLNSPIYLQNIKVTIVEYDIFENRVKLQPLAGFIDRINPWQLCRAFDVTSIDSNVTTSIPRVASQPDVIEEEQDEDELSRQFRQHMRELKRIGELLGYHTSVTIV